jgi:hypothetical protein
MKKVKIGGHAYNVTQKREIYDSEGMQLAGQIQYKSQLILYDPSLPMTHQCETMLHEIIHGISFDRRLDLDEHQVDQIAAGLWAVMQDNKYMFGIHFFDYMKSVVSKVKLGLSKK